MSSKIGLLFLLIAVCAVSVYFAYEGFGNVGGKIESDYYNSVGSQFGEGWHSPPIIRRTIDRPSQTMSHYDYLIKKKETLAALTPGRRPIAQVDRPSTVYYLPYNKNSYNVPTSYYRNLLLMLVLFGVGIFAINYIRRQSRKVGFLNL